MEASKMGLSVYELAKRSKLGRTQLGAYLKGNKGMTDKGIEALFEVLNIKLYSTQHDKSHNYSRNE